MLFLKTRPPTRVEKAYFYTGEFLQLAVFCLTLLASENFLCRICTGFSTETNKYIFMTYFHNIGEFTLNWNDKLALVLAIVS